MTRKKRKKPVQQKGIHDNKRKADTLTRHSIKFCKNKVQRLLNPTNTLWKDLMLYRLNFDLILNFNQDLAFFRQKQIVRYNRHRNLQK